MHPLAAPAPSRPITTLVLDFLAYLEFERGLSRNTLEAYRSDLQQYERFLDDRGVDVLAATGEDVGGFLEELAAGRTRGDGTVQRPAAAATVQRKAACLRSFYRHVRREGLLEADPTADVRGPRKRAAPAPLPAVSVSCHHGGDAAPLRPGPAPWWPLRSGWHESLARRFGSCRFPQRGRPALVAGWHVGGL